MNLPSQNNLSEAAVDVDDELLRKWPLPELTGNGTKDARGNVLVVGGCSEMPGAVILAGLGALRAGAGRLAIATAASVAPLVAAAIPEARVIALPEKSGCIRASAASLLAQPLARADAVLVGPGMQHPPRILSFLRRLELPECSLVIDAEAIAALGLDSTLLTRLKGAALLTPHAGEMAQLTGRARDEIEARQQASAVEAARALGVTIALKGKETIIASPDGKTWISCSGNLGLGTSGSGDVLAGLVTGLIARRASVTQAAVWGSHVHGRAGEELARTVGPLGYLARELLPLLPRLVCER